MAENFDPYRKWLGIPPEEQPANFYRLLGIALYEDDLDVITHAADRQMSHVRKFQAGKNGHLSQQVLNELAKARVCLLDRAQKIAYDQQLQKTLGGARPASSAPVAASRAPQRAPVPSSPPPGRAPVAVAKPVLPPAGVATIEPPMAMPVSTPVDMPMAVGPASPVPLAGRSTRATITRARRKSSALPLVLGICGLAAVAGLAAVVAVAMNGAAEEERIDAPTTVATSTRLPQPSTPSVTDAPDTTSTEPGDDPRDERPRRGRRRPRNPDDNGGSRQPNELIIPENPENKVEGDAPSLPQITRDPNEKPLVDETMPADEADEGEGEPADDEPQEDLTDKPTVKPTPVKPEREKPQTKPEPPVKPEVVDSPQRAAEFAAAVTGVNDAFAARDLKEAARQLAAARRLMHGATEETQVAEVAEMLSHLGTFWRLASTTARKLKAGVELSFAGKTATFDAFSDGDVVLLVEGQRLSRRLEDLELHYLVALVERGAKADSKSRLAIAAFLAVDGNASEPERRDEAKTALAEALSLGGHSPALEQRLGIAPAP